MDGRGVSPRESNAGYAMGCEPGKLRPGPDAHERGVVAPVLHEQPAAVDHGLTDHLRDLLIGGDAQAGQRALRGVDHQLDERLLRRRLAWWRRVKAFGRTSSLPVGYPVRVGQGGKPATGPAIRASPSTFPSFFQRAEATSGRPRPASAREIPFRGGTTAMTCRRRLPDIRTPRRRARAVRVPLRRTERAHRSADIAR